MAEEPGALVRDLQRPVHLMGADTLLARAHEIDGLQHFVQRDAAVLEHGAYLHRELLAAFVAFPYAATVRLTLELRGIAVSAAVRADRVAGPKNGLQVLKGTGFVVKVLF